MNRADRIPDIAKRRLEQGFSVDAQYRILNAARDKRKRRRERNVRDILSGGTGIPIIGGKS